RPASPGRPRGRWPARSPAPGRPPGRDTRRSGRAGSGSTATAPPPAGWRPPRPAPAAGAGGAPRPRPTARAPPRGGRGGAPPRGGSRAGSPPTGCPGGRPGARHRPARPPPPPARARWPRRPGSRPGAAGTPARRPAPAPPARTRPRAPRTRCGSLACPRVLLLATGVLQRLFHLAHSGRHPRLDRAQRHPHQGGHLALGVAAVVGEQQGLALGGRQLRQRRPDLGPALGRLDLVLDPGLGVGLQLPPLVLVPPAAP